MSVVKRGPNEWPAHHIEPAPTMISCTTTMAPYAMWSGRCERSRSASTKPLSAKTRTGENTKSPRDGLSRLPRNPSANLIVAENAPCE